MSASDFIVLNPQFTNPRRFCFRVDDNWDVYILAKHSGKWEYFDNYGNKSVDEWLNDSQSIVFERTR